MLCIFLLVLSWTQYFESTSTLSLFFLGVNRTLRIGGSVMYDLIFCVCL